MIVAIIFALLLFASVVFHFVSPWQISPLGSNWGTIDATLSFTFLVTGIFFVAIVAFMIFCVYKYQTKPGRRSEYQREDKKLENRLIWMFLMMQSSLKPSGSSGLGVFVCLGTIKSSGGPALT